MKLNRIIAFIALSLIVALSTSGSCLAKEVSRDQAIQIAKTITDTHFPSNWDKSRSNIRIQRSLKSNYPFYVCDVDGEGFVLVAKDERCPKVLAYSFESSFSSDLSQAPPTLQYYIESIVNTCNKYISGEVTLSSDEELMGQSPIKSSHMQKSTFIAPLMTTKWKVDSVFCEKYPEGAMANASPTIAMGQVFRYFELPEMSMGEYCYLYGPENDEICTNFAYEYDFNNMPDETANEQVKTVLNYMAAACRLQPEGASMLTYRETMPEYFFYSNNMRKVEYWEHNFIPVLKHQLALSRPVPAEWKGHHFVIDGYYDTDFFHFNFGMGGEYDGFYLLDFPNVNVESNHLLLNCYINYHPKSFAPIPQNLAIATAGDSLNISWSMNMPDSVATHLNRYIILRDGVIPILETTSTSVMIHPQDFGISSEINCIAVFDTYGTSELSEPVKYISDHTLADIPSLELRQEINIQLGYIEDLNRIPFVGELEMVKKLNIDFLDQRGIDQLPELRHLFVDGMEIGGLLEGDYLSSLNYLMLHRCRQFDFTVLENTESLNVIQGSDGLPYDFFDLRHNSDAGVISFASHDNIINNLGDLYGADKYFQNLTYFNLFHITYLTIDSCYISYESYLDVLPNIKGNEPAVEHTSPSSFVPCYPSPARNTNVPNTSQVSWQGNYDEAGNVYYNVYIGKTRDQLQLIAPFITGKSFDYNFENDLDYFWRVEAFHNDTTYYSGIFHFSTYESFPIPFVENFDEYYANCDVSFESPFWNNYGDDLAEPTSTSRDIKRSGRYSLEVMPSSDAGIIIEAQADSAYLLEFYFQNNKAEFAIDLMQGGNDGESLALNSRIQLFGDNLGTFDYGDSKDQFLFIPFEWNHAKFILDMPTGLARLYINDVEISQWNWNVQLDGAPNTNPLRGINFSNSGVTGSGLIDDIHLKYTQSTGIKNIAFENLNISYNPINHELLINDGLGKITGIELFDLQGRKITTFASHGNQRIKLKDEIPNGVYIMSISTKEGMPLSAKISVVR